MGSLEEGLLARKELHEHSEEGGAEGPQGQVSNRSYLHIYPTSPTSPKTQTIPTLNHPQPLLPRRSVEPCCCTCNILESRLEDIRPIHIWLAIILDYPTTQPYWRKGHVHHIYQPSYFRSCGRAFGGLSSRLTDVAELQLDGQHEKQWARLPWVGLYYDQKLCAGLAIKLEFVHDGKWKHLYIHSKGLVEQM